MITRRVGEVIELYDDAGRLIGTVEVCHVSGSGRARLRFDGPVRVRRVESDAPDTVE